MNKFTGNNKDFTNDIISMRSDIQLNKHLTIDRFNSIERHRDSVKKKIKDLEFQNHIKDKQITELYQIVESLLNDKGETLSGMEWTDHQPDHPMYVDKDSQEWKDAVENNTIFEVK